MFIWRGASGTNYNSAPNWLPAEVPDTAAETAIFDALALQTTVAVITPVTVQGWLFNPDALSYTTSGGQVTVASGGLVQNQSSTTQVIGNVIAGTGGVLQSGTGALTLSGNNTYSGGTTVSGGRLAIENLGALGTGEFTLQNGAELLAKVSGTETAGNLVIAGGQAGRISAATGESFTVSGLRLGSGATLNVGSAGNAGTVTLTVEPGSSIASGMTINVDHGTLRSGEFASFGSLSFATGNGTLSVAAGAIYDMNGFLTPVSTLQGGGTIRNGGAAAATLSLGGASASAASQSFDGSIQNGTGITSLEKLGSSTMLLSGASTYTGGTTISGGALVAGNNAAFGTGLVTLSGGVLGTSGGSRTIANDITVTAASTIDANRAGAAITDFKGALTLSSGTLTVTGSSSIVLSGTVTGAGSLRLEEFATLRGTNAHTGGTTIVSGAGAFVENDSALGTGLVTLNGGLLSLLNPRTLGNAITVTAAGSVLTANAAATVTGSIALNGNQLMINPVVSMTISGVISGTGGISKGDPGTLTLSGPNTYTGGTTISSGTLRIDHVGALGTGSVTLSNGAELLSNVAGETAGTLTIGANATGRISATAGTSFTAFGVQIGNNATVNIGSSGNSGTVTLDGIMAASTGTRINVEYGILAQGSGLPSQTYNGTLSVAAGAALNLNGMSLSIGTLEGAGTITNTAAPNVSLSIGESASAAATQSFSGAITDGAGQLSLQKQGTGTLTLSGVNTFTGLTTVTAGTLAIAATGSLAGGLQVNAGTAVNDGTVAGATTVAGGTLGGTGTFGAVTVQASGTLAPGASPGVINTGSLTLQAGATLQAEIGGASLGQYDRVNVTGTVSLGGATLGAQLVGGFTPVAGQSYVIVSNDGTDAVAGTFTGLFEGASVTLGGAALQITYQGGDGNDVVLVAPGPGSAGGGDALAPSTPPQTPGAPERPVLLASEVQGLAVSVLRGPLPQAEAEQLAAAIPPDGRAVLITQLIERAENTTGAAIELWAFLVGRTPDGATLDSQVDLLVDIAAQPGLANPGLNAWIGLGASLANPAFASRLTGYLSLSDEAFVARVFSEVFGAPLDEPARAGLLQDTLDTYQAYYAQAQTTADPSGTARAAGAFVADLLFQASSIEVGPYDGAEETMLGRAVTQGDSVFGAGLFA